MVCVPKIRPDELPLYEQVVVFEHTFFDTLSINNSIEATPEPSLTEAWMVIFVPLKTEPSVGLVMVTVGGVVSGG